MEAPAVINRYRRPFLLPVWLSFAAAFGLFVAALVAFLIYRSATTTTVVVLARHVEKDVSSIQDPPLSPEGEQRAERLAQMFGRGKGVGRIDAMTFTSPSTVRCFLQLAGQDARRALDGVLVACIGPVTAETARASGLRVGAVATAYTLAGLVDALRSALSPRPGPPVTSGGR